MDTQSREVKLGIGETVTVPLAGSAGGYRWQPEVSGDAGAVEVSVDYGDDPATEGRWRDELATIRGARAGGAVVRFALRRAWEPEAQADGAVSDHVLKVTVVDT